LLLPDTPLPVLSDCPGYKQDSAAEACLPGVAIFQQPQLLPSAAPHPIQSWLVMSGMWDDPDRVADLVARTAELRAGLRLLTPP